MSAICPECSAVLAGREDSCPHCGWSVQRVTASEIAATPKKKSKWWVYAILSPLLSLGLGILVALAIPQHQDDWLGMRFIIPAIGALLLGCVLSVVFTIVSVKRKEEGSFYAVAVCILAVLFLLAASSGRR